MRASDNSVVKIFGPGSLSTPTATTSVSGISELATNSETTTGTATNRVVTPAGLNAVTVAERSTSNSTYLALAGGTLTGVLAATAGSNSAPAINFGDSDSGIFGGTNTVSLAAGGTTRLTADTGVDITGTLAVAGAITSTSNLTIAEKVIHAGDTDTAVRFPAADTVSVETSGTERLRADSLGHFIVGSSTARTNFFNSSTNHSPRLQVEAANTNNGRAAIGLIHGASSTLGPYLALGKHRGSVGGNTVVQSADELGKITFQGNDGAQFVESASIVGFVDGTPGSDDMPGRLVFSTTADGAASPIERLRIDSTGLSTFSGNVSFGDNNITNVGTIALDTIKGDADDNTNINFAGSDVINIKPAGTTRLAINTSGINVTGAITGTGDLTIGTNTLHIDPSNNRVGIGTTSPVTDIHTVSSSDHIITHQSSSAGADIRMNFRDSGNTDRGGIHYLFNGNSLKFITSTEERMRINSSGNVGIGTTSPTNKLHVEGGVGSGGFITKLFNTVGSGDVGGHVLFLDANRSDTTNTRLIDSKDNKFTVFSNGAANFAGNVGIGTTSPSAPLHVATNANGTTDMLILHADADGIGQNDGIASIKFVGNNNHAAFIKGGHGNGGDTVLTFHTDDFDTGASANPQERMRIMANGNVGIGTTSPSTKLNISQASTGAALLIQTTNNNTRAQAEFKGKDSSGNDVRLRVGGDGDFGGNIFTLSNHKLGFATNNAAPQMVLDTSGNLGIGTISPDQSLHVHKGSAGTVDSTPTSVITLENSDNAILQFLCPSNKSAQLRFGDPSDNGAGYIDYDHNTNRLAFGTAGPERMRIDSDGRVLIGGTSKVFNEFLSVQKGGDSTHVATFYFDNTQAQTAVIIKHDRAGHQGDGTSATMIGFLDQTNGTSGSITSNGNSTSYNTSSDYRLKENITNISDGITRIKQLIPKKFNFISDGDKTLKDGFLAHEVSSVVPEAVAGEKDAVDKDGNIDPQQLDQSKLVPLLVAAVQELIGKVEALEAA